MTSSSEKVLWGFKLAKGYELLFTSERMVFQNPTGLEQTLRGLSPLFGGIGAGFFATYHSEAYVGHDLTINPRLASDSIQYSEISRLKILSNADSSVFAWQFFRGAEPKPIMSIPLKEEDHKSSLSVIAPLLGDRVSVIPSKTGKELGKVSLDEFRQHLVEIGLKVAPLEEESGFSKFFTDKMVGAIRILNANYDFVIKEQRQMGGVVPLDFVFSNVRGKNGTSVAMSIVRRKEEGVEVKWQERDKRLIEQCKQDTDLIRSIVDVSKTYEMKCQRYGEAWIISGMRKQEKIQIGSQKVVLEYAVHVRQLWFNHLPPIEMFQVMDKMGVRLHSLET